MIDLEKVKKVHFIGLGGIGLSAIARLFLLSNKQISGSDQNANRITDELEKIGVTFYCGHQASNLPVDTDLVIYTIAIDSTNPELLKAKEKNILCLSYPEALGLISKTKKTIAVAGTHGKTTTTAMIAEMLITGGLSPTVIVGSLLSRPDGKPTNFISGLDDWLVVEACEYRRSFLNLKPDVLAITNIEEDHLDYYRDLADIQSAFRELALKVPRTGTIVYSSQDKNIKPVIDNLNCQLIDYSSRDYNFELSLPGEHNRQNARASLTVASLVGVRLNKAISILKTFNGPWRRFEYKGQTDRGVFLYDDYAHHPTEIKATLKAAIEKFRPQPVIVVFQPHLYSRTRQLFDNFVEALALAHEIYITDIYAAREKDDGLTKAEDLVEKLKAGGRSAFYVAQPKQAVVKALTKAKPGSVVFTIGAGNISQAGEKALSL